MKALLAAAAALLCSLAGFIPLEAAVLVRISPDETAHQVVEAGGAVWLAMESGAYRLSDNSPTPVLPDVPVTAIAEIDGQIWLGSQEGVFRIERGRPVPILRDVVGALPVTVIETEGDVVWLGTRRVSQESQRRGGLFRIEAGVATPVLEDWIHDISRIDGRVWVAAARNAYRLNGNGPPQPVFEESTEVSEIVKAAGAVWLVTNTVFGRYGPCLRLDGGAPALVDGLQGFEVISVAEVDGEAWFATTAGVFRLAGGLALRVPIAELDEPVNAIRILGGQVWLASTDRAYRRLRGVFAPIPEIAQGLNIKGVDWVNDRVWLWGETGAYRFDEDVDIRLETTTFSFWGLELLLGRVVRLKHARYDRGGQDPYAGQVAGDFEAILEADRQKFEVEEARNNFIPAMRLERTMPVGLTEMHLTARDVYGNTARYTSHPVLAVPWWILVLLTLLLTLLTVLIKRLISLPAVWKSTARRVIAEPTNPTSTNPIAKSTKSHVFVSYVRDNEALVLQLCRELESAGIEVWRDRASIGPGIRWKRAIRRAIRTGSFFIACFSSEYSSREKSYMNKEMLIAIDELQQRQTDRAWFIPVLLSECEIPDTDIGSGETLQDLQRVDLSCDWDAGVEKLIRAIKPDP